MKSFMIINDYDGNDSFEVEADNPQEAMEKALKELGWWVAEGEEIEA